MSRNKHKSNLINKIFALFFILSPFVICLITVVTYKLTHQGLSWRFFIKWNDEAAYYSLVKTFIEHGNPLGYWAYDGVHAVLGTGGPWGFIILLPYALFGKIFGWDMSSPFFANVLFLCTALFIFLRCVKPNSKDLKWLTFIPYIFLPLILYTVTAMTEPLRYALAIIITGQLIALANHKPTKSFTKVIIPATIIFAAQIYIFLAIFIPVYIFLVMRKAQFFKKLIFAVIASVIVIIPSFYLLKLTACTYSFQDVETIKSYFDTGLIRGCKYLAFLLVNECKEFLRIESLGYGKMFVWHTYAYCALILIALSAIVYARIKKNDTSFLLYLTVAYTMLAFLIAYCLIYSSSDPTMTVFRLMSIPMLFAVLVLMLAGNKAIRLCVVAVCAIGLMCLPKAGGEFLLDRFVTKEELAQYDELEERLKELVLLEPLDSEKKEQSRYKNTVAVYMIYSLPPYILCALPAGAGVNMMTGDSFDNESKYLLFDKKDEISNRVIEQNKEILVNQYEILYDTYNFIIFRALLG